jgi:hypothetical protein
MLKYATFSSSKHYFDGVQNVVLNFPTAKTCHLEAPNPVDMGGSVALKDFVG